MVSEKQPEATTAGLASFTPETDSIANNVAAEQPNRNFNDRQFFAWFNKNDGPLERRVITKLDFFTLTFAFSGFFILAIDRNVLANAYVSGMREDLEFFGNELVQLNSLFDTGYCTAMIPATLLVTRFPAQRIVPVSMALWGLFTLLCYRATSFSELAGYRFLVGFFEGPYMCSIYYVLGSWYRGDELMRRAGIFYASSGVGSLTTGLLAARVYESLDGALGHPGWRWMYIVSACMTFPIAAWGAISLPGTPKDGKRWYLTDEEFAMAKARMSLEGRLDPQGLSLNKKSLKRFLGRWHFWVLVPWNLMWMLGFISLVSGGPALWLRSNEQYSIVQVNNFTSIGPSLGILFILTYTWIVDKCGRKAIVPVIGFATLIHFIAKFAWIFYEKTPFSYKWFAIATANVQVSLSPINYSTANLACAGDAEERAFVVSAMVAVITAFTAWIPLLTFPTIEAPRFPKGYTMEAVMQVAYFFMTCVVVWKLIREDRKHKGDQEQVGQSVEEKTQD